MTSLTRCLKYNIIPTVMLLTIMAGQTFAEHPGWLPPKVSLNSPYWFKTSLVTGDLEWDHTPCDKDWVEYYRLIDAVFTDKSTAEASGYRYAAYWADINGYASYNFCGDDQYPPWPAGYFVTNVMCTGEGTGSNPGVTHHCLVPIPGHEDLIIPTSMVPYESTGLSGTSDNKEARLSNAIIAAPEVTTQYCLSSAVDLKTGNLNHMQQVGFLTFSYNSLDSYAGPLGIGWTHDYNMFVSANSDGSLYIKASDGNLTLYNLGEDGNYHADVRNKDSSLLVKNQDGTYTRTTKYGKFYNFNVSGRLISIIDSNGNATLLTYTGNDLTGITDASGRTASIVVMGGKIVYVTDFANNSYSISYSASGLLISIAEPMGNRWYYQYDTNDMMVRKVDPSQNTSTYVYDPVTRKLTSSTDPDNVVTAIAYNTGSDAVSTTTNVTGKDGRVWTHRISKQFNVPLQITDPYGNSTLYAYDLNNNLTSITYPDGTSTVYAYDSNRNVTSMTDTGGRQTVFSYNVQNRVTTIQDPAGGTALFSYDPAGNVSSYTDPAGAQTQVQRDIRGNITRVIDPLGHMVQYGYDLYNNVISITDPTNITVTLTRDILGNILSMQDPLSNFTEFSYNTNGSLIETIDPIGNVMSFSYDANGNRSVITDPMQNATSYTYNYKGFPTRVVDALQKTTILSYVNTGCPSCGGGGDNLTSLTDAAGATTNFVYDSRGLLTGVSDPLQRTTSYSYDINGLLIGKTDRNGSVLAYTNTPTGKLSSITYPDQAQVIYTYDNLDRLIQMQDQIGTSYYAYDTVGRITSYTDPHGFALSYAYDAAGNITRITYPDSSAVTYVYDAANRLTTVTNWLAEQAVYSYDQAGRVAALTQFNGTVTTFSYDAASRLTGMVGSAASYGFTLDANGNRVQSTENQPVDAVPANAVSAVFEYNAQRNRLLSASTLIYAYDNEGHLVTADTTCLTFDYDHRLIEIGDEAQFAYDGAGNRLSATRREDTILYVYDPWGNLIAEANAAGMTRKYIYGRGLLAMATPTGRYCYHFNGVGSTVALTDMSGVVVNSYAYDPFGVILAQNEQVVQPFQFVGQYGVMAEPEGLYYMRARYYDPNVGRFISEDPLGFAGGDVNLYAYVQNNPINAIDPLGLLTEVITFSPVGYGKSSFGHTALNINGTTYSFGEKGWFTENTAEYLKRNSFRDATGQELNLSEEQETLLLEVIKKDMAENQQWTSQNSCVSKTRDVLEQGTGLMMGFPPRPPIIAPTDFRDNLAKFGYAIKTNYYPRSR